MNAGPAIFSSSVPKRMRHFCTLFDSNYLTRGLALHESLRKHAPSSILHILAMDDEAHALLEALRLENVRLIRLRDLEDPQLLAVKPTRSKAEYCWTLTPSLPLHVLKSHPNVEMVSYIDADCLFFSSPEPIFEELGDRSVLAIEHRYSSDCASYEKTSGRFNVGMLCFRRDRTGLEALNWWRERCLEWCFARYEDGRYGDQLYLNEWPKLFGDSLAVLRHPGGGVAPWNVWRWRLRLGAAGPEVSGRPVIFFHFHAFRAFEVGGYDAAEGYRRSLKQIELIYNPYAEALRRQLERVRAIDPSFSAGLAAHRPVRAPESQARGWLRQAARLARAALSPRRPHDGLTDG